ncbi:MAG: helix-hairpin-helix domain-containing protein, partial [Deltaproteobacteria bacterium]|nr:helix-hairpin-helix domain-containing protein [Deltaproteobacteria bacterium]
AELGGAIASDDLGRLTNISGVGKKTAERLCLELKGKIDFIPAPAPFVPAKGDKDAQAATALFDDAVSALVNLGYPAAQAREAVAGISALRAGQVSLEELIRLALRSLAS